MVLMKVVPFAAMAALECFDVGLSTLGKAAISKGMSHFVFVVYSNALATLIIFPSSFFFDRSKNPPITFSFLFQLFLLSLCGVTVMQNCVFTGLSYSSPTLASAIAQLIPAFTFLIAVIFRMENLDLSSSTSRIKILATLVCISGALVIISYKGAPIGPIHSEPESISFTTVLSPAPAVNSWVIGGIFLLIASLSLSIFITFQAAILKEYPSEITVVSFYCLFGTIQCAIVALIAEKNNLNAWKLRPDIQLISVSYSAVFGNVVTYATTAWCTHTKGPVFVAMFKPLGIAIAAFMSVIFLGDTLHVGSIVGAIIIVVGFYGVIWAQSKEEVKVNKINPLPLLHTTPLLQNHTDV